MALCKTLQLTPLRPVDSWNFNVLSSSEWSQERKFAHKYGCAEFRKRYCKNILNRIIYSYQLSCKHLCIYSKEYIKFWFEKFCTNDFSTTIRTYFSAFVFYSTQLHKAAIFQTIKVSKMHNVHWLTKQYICHVCFAI